MTHRSTGSPIRVLFLSDSHLGFDLPVRPRVERRRRGSEFFANFDRALRPALRGDVDLVVHGGDLFYRARVRPGLVLMVLDRIRNVLEAGVPVVIVPGNHERSRIPSPLLWMHPNLHILDRPKTVTIRVRGTKLSLSGFPYAWGDLRSNFPGLVERTAWDRERSGARLMIVHHAVEGAVVGPSDFTFGGGKDVIRSRELPSGFAAVLSGHIHRHQVLRSDNLGKPLPCPVFYCGSTERTSFAEEDETKGYLVLDVIPTCDGRGEIANWQFVELPTRNMVSIELDAPGTSRSNLRRALLDRLVSIDPQSIVRVRTVGACPEPADAGLDAESVRRIAPKTMNVTIARGHRDRGQDGGWSKKRSEPASERASIPSGARGG